MIIVKDKGAKSPIFVARNTNIQPTHTNNNSGEGGINEEELNKYLEDYVTETELNNKGYLTKIPSEYITESELSNKGYITGIPSEYITETELNQKGYITSIPSEYITETELNNKGYATTEALNGKQEKLTSGDNIKTINGQSILGKGNITIEGDNRNANIVELTQEEYDNLEEKDENTIYVITDAPAIDTPDTSIFITESELLEMGYATQGYVDEKLGDIETILNNIIGQE